MPEPRPVRWDDLQAFLAVARTGGLSAAARETGSSAPTLGRRMRGLERALGQELFVRRTHGYDLTEAGAAMHAQLEGVATRIGHVAAPATGARPPLVKLSAGTWTALALVRRLPEIAGVPPDVRLRFVSSEEVLSINRRDASIGIRNMRPDGPGLAGRRLAGVQFAAYAAPGSPADWIAVTADTPSARWLAGRREPVAHEVSHPRLALDMALVGAGRTILPTFIGDEADGLERASAPIPELAHDQWLVVHDDDRALPELRRTIDRITSVLS